MTTFRFQTAMVVMAGVALMACSRKPAEPAPVATAPKAVPAKTETASAGGDGKLDPNDPSHGKRKLMGLDTPVYVDGVQVAVLRAGEMPSIPTIQMEGAGIRYRIADYLKAIGVAPESLKSIHFHGNQDRIASIEGSELKKDPNRFQFQFTSGTTGAPLQRWDTEGLKNEFVANEIRRVTIYVHKASPAIHPQKRCHLGPDGDCSDAIPYSDGTVAKGTRVYVDGHMVGFVKRRQVGEALAMGDTAEGEHKFSVAKLVAQMGIDPTGVTNVELMAGDDVIGRASGEDFLKNASNVWFTLPKHNHGKVRVHVPAEFQAHESGNQDHDALVSAVLVYKSSKPAVRDLVAISEDTDMSVQLAAVDDARGRGER
jgi:hypothetical protein